MALPSSFFLWFCCFAWLSSPVNLASQASRGEAQIAAGAEVEPEAESWSLLQSVDEEHSPGLLPPLFKVLSGRRSGVPRLQPDSRALHYMKKLYKAYATKEGIPKPTRSHLYNTVRLFTPQPPQKHASRDQVTGILPSADLLFNLDRVAAVEHLLKSVLLYTFNNSASLSSAVKCVCNLVITQPKSPSKTLSGAPSSSTFSSQFELSKDHRWLEIDVTSLLQPLVASSQRSVHMSVGFSCPRGPQEQAAARGRLLGALLGRPPSLILYMNDTSARAHHRACPSLRRPARDALPPAPQEPPRPASFNLSQYFRRLLFPRDECALHDFRLSFGQLGWDRWIVAPQRYNARYCRGACPRAVRQRYGSAVHTVAQNIVAERLDASVPRPSCVPAAYHPLSVLTVEPDASIAYKEYENMVATRCTCR